MEKVLIIGCDIGMDDICIACSRCLVGFNRREGEFKRYNDKETEIIGLLNCGGCPGSMIVTRMAQFGLWNCKLGEKPTKVHIANCIVEHCPYKDVIIQKIKAKAGVEVIEGSHPYIPNNIFA